MRGHFLSLARGFRLLVGSFLPVALVLASDSPHDRVSSLVKEISPEVRESLGQERFNSIWNQFSGLSEWSTASNQMVLDLLRVEFLIRYHSGIVDFDPSPREEVSRWAEERLRTLESDSYISDVHPVLSSQTMMALQTLQLVYDADYLERLIDPPSWGRQEVEEFLGWAREESEVPFSETGDLGSRIYEVTHFRFVSTFLREVLQDQDPALNGLGPKEAEADSRLQNLLVEVASLFPNETGVDPEQSLIDETVDEFDLEQLSESWSEFMDSLGLEDSELGQFLEELGLEEGLEEDSDSLPTKVLLEAQGLIREREVRDQRAAELDQNENAVEEARSEDSPEEVVQEEIGDAKGDDEGGSEQNLIKLLEELEQELEQIAEELEADAEELEELGQESDADLDEVSEELRVEVEELAEALEELREMNESGELDSERLRAILEMLVEAGVELGEIVEKLAELLRNEGLAEGFRELIEGLEEKSELLSDLGDRLAEITAELGMEEKSLEEMLEDFEESAGILEEFLEGEEEQDGWSVAPPVLTTEMDLSEQLLDAIRGEGAVVLAVYHPAYDGVYFRTKFQSLATNYGIETNPRNVQDPIATPNTGKSIKVRQPKLRSGNLALFTSPGGLAPSNDIEFYWSEETGSYYFDTEGGGGSVEYDVVLGENYENLAEYEAYLLRNQDHYWETGDVSRRDVPEVIRNELESLFSQSIPRISKLKILSSVVAAIFDYSMEEDQYSEFRSAADHWLKEVFRNCRFDGPRLTAHPKGACVSYSDLYVYLLRLFGREDSGRGADRVLGSRVAGGYVGKGGLVTSFDGHAWPEVYIQGRGWLPFEPTFGPSSQDEELMAARDSAFPGLASAGNPGIESTQVTAEMAEVFSRLKEAGVTKIIVGEYWDEAQRDREFRGWDLAHESNRGEVGGSGGLRDIEVEYRFDPAKREQARRESQEILDEALANLAGLDWKTIQGDSNLQDWIHSTYASMSASFGHRSSFRETLFGLPLQNGLPPLPENRDGNWLDTFYWAASFLNLPTGRVMPYYLDFFFKHTKEHLADGMSTTPAMRSQNLTRQRAIFESLWAWYHSELGGFDENEWAESADHILRTWKEYLEVLSTRPGFRVEPRDYWIVVARVYVERMIPPIGPSYEKYFEFLNLIRSEIGIEDDEVWRLVLDSIRLAAENSNIFELELHNRIALSEPVSAVLSEENRSGEVLDFLFERVTTKDSLDQEHSFLLITQLFIGGIPSGLLPEAITKLIVAKYLRDLIPMWESGPPFGRDQLVDIEVFFDVLWLALAVYQVQGQISDDYKTRVSQFVGDYLGIRITNGSIWGKDNRVFVPFDVLRLFYLPQTEVFDGYRKRQWVWGGAGKLPGWEEDDPAVLKYEAEVELDVGDFLKYLRWATRTTNVFYSQGLDPLDRSFPFSEEMFFFVVPNWIDVEVDWQWNPGGLVPLGVEAGPEDAFLDLLTQIGSEMSDHAQIDHLHRALLIFGNEGRGIARTIPLSLRIPYSELVLETIVDPAMEEVKKILEENGYFTTFDTGKVVVYYSNWAAAVGPEEGEAVDLVFLRYFLEEVDRLRGELLSGAYPLDESEYEILMEFFPAGETERFSVNDDLLMGLQEAQINALVVLSHLDFFGFFGREMETQIETLRSHEGQALDYDSLSPPFEMNLRRQVGISSDLIGFFEARYRSEPSEETALALSEVITTVFTEVLHPWGSMGLARDGEFGEDYYGLLNRVVNISMEIARLGEVWNTLYEGIRFSNSEPYFEELVSASLPYLSTDSLDRLVDYLNQETLSPERAMVLSADVMTLARGLEADGIERIESSVTQVAEVVSGESILGWIGDETDGEWGLFALEAPRVALFERTRRIIDGKEVDPVVQRQLYERWGFILAAYSSSEVEFETRLRLIRESSQGDALSPNLLEMMFQGVEVRMAQGDRNFPGLNGVIDLFETYYPDFRDRVTQEIESRHPEWMAEVNLGLFPDFDQESIDVPVLTVDPLYYADQDQRVLDALTRAARPFGRRSARGTEIEGLNPVSYFLKRRQLGDLVLGDWTSRENGSASEPSSESYFRLLSETAVRHRLSLDGGEIPVDSRGPQRSWGGNEVWIPDTLEILSGGFSAGNGSFAESWHGLNEQVEAGVPFVFVLQVISKSSQANLPYVLLMLDDAIRGLRSEDSDPFEDFMAFVAYFSGYRFLVSSLGEEGFAYLRTDRTSGNGDHFTPFLEVYEKLMILEESLSLGGAAKVVERLELLPFDEGREMFMEWFVMAGIDFLYRRFEGEVNEPLLYEAAEFHQFILGAASRYDPVQNFYLPKVSKYFADHQIDDLNEELREIWEETYRMTGEAFEGFSYADLGEDGDRLYEEAVSKILEEAGSEDLENRVDLRTFVINLLSIHFDLGTDRQRGMLRSRLSIPEELDREKLTWNEYRRFSIAAESFVKLHKTISRYSEEDRKFIREISRLSAERVDRFDVATAGMYRSVEALIERALGLAGEIGAVENFGETWKTEPRENLDALAFVLQLIGVLTEPGSPLEELDLELAILPGGDSDQIRRGLHYGVLYYLWKSQGRTGYAYFQNDLETGTLSIETDWFSESTLRRDELRPAVGDSEDFSGLLDAIDVERVALGRIQDWLRRRRLDVARYPLSQYEREIARFQRTRTEQVFSLSLEQFENALAVLGHEEMDWLELEAVTGGTQIGLLRESIRFEMGQSEVIDEFRVGVGFLIQGVELETPPSYRLLVEPVEAR